LRTAVLGDSHEHRRTPSCTVKFVCIASMYIVMYIGIVQCIGQRHRTKCYRYSDVLKWREIGAAL